MPELSKQVTKIISISLFAVTAIIKILCIFILSGQMDKPCIAGWHVNEEISNHLLLITTGLIPDILMLLSIGAGMLFKDSNIGADPGSIIYNFLLGFLSIGAFFPLFGVEDCKSEDLSKIKSLGVFAFVAGIFHIANAVTCLLFLGKEETTDTGLPSTAPSTSRPDRSRSAKPSTSKASRAK